MVSLFTWLSVVTGVNPVYVTTVPPRLQFFKEQSVTFNCQGANVSSEWIIMRHVFLENATSKCGSVWGTRHKSNSCKLSMTLPWDTGVYWCQSLTKGIVSEKHNFTVSDTSTILHLDSTTTPPSVGMDITLSCLHKHGPFREPVYFYKDNSVIARCPTTSNVTIRNITKAHEGFYKCGPAGKRGSPISWISVVNHTTTAVNVPAFTNNITRGGESLCKIGGLHNGDTETKFTATDASPVETTPRDRGGLTAYDDLYAFLGGLLFIIMLLAVSYLVFHMCTVTRLIITRKLSRKNSDSIDATAANSGVDRLQSVMMKTAFDVFFFTCFV